MSPEIFDLFPLSVFKDKVNISQDEKNTIIDFILNTEKKLAI